MSRKLDSTDYSSGCGACLHPHWRPTERAVDRVLVCCNPVLAADREIPVGTTRAPVWCPCGLGTDFVVCHCPNRLGLPDGQENIGGASNPAALIFQILTDPAVEDPAPGQPVGCGFSREEIDVESFRVVGASLAAAGRGLSIVLDPIPHPFKLVSDVLTMFDLTLYVGPKLIVLAPSEGEGERSAGAGLGLKVVVDASVPADEVRLVDERRGVVARAKVSPE